MGEDDAAVGDFGSGDFVEAVHEIGVGEAVEAEFADAAVVVAAGDGEPFCDGWHGVVEGGVEAGDLREFGEGFLEGFDEGDFLREVGGIEGLDAVEFGEEFGGDELMVCQVGAAVDDAMADGYEGGVGDLFLDVVDQIVCGLEESGGFHGADGWGGSGAGAGGEL